jgi:hypothetical protein
MMLNVPYRTKNGAIYQEIVDKENVLPQSTQNIGYKWARKNGLTNQSYNLVYKNL